MSIKVIIETCVLMFIFTGCNFFSVDKFDGSEKSLKNMINNLPTDEQIQFIKDFELVVYVLGGEEKIIGFNKEKINEEVFKIKEFAKNKNSKFLQSKITNMQQKSQEKTYLHINHGIISEPQIGFNYKKEYFIKDLEDIYNLSGDIFEYANKMEFKEGFIKGCLKNKSIANKQCLCVWDKMNINYSYKQLLENAKHENNEYLEHLKVFLTDCRK